MALYTGAGPIILPETWRKEYTMINKTKKEDVISEKKTEYACPMMDAIAMITARDFDESGLFDFDSPHTVLVCDIIFKLYLKGEYKVAMEVLAAAFMLADMETSGELLSVAAAGYTDGKGKYYMDRFFEYSDIYAQAIRMRQMSAEKKLTRESIEAILLEEKPNQKERIVLRGDRFKRLFPPDLPVSKREDYIAAAMEFYGRHRHRQRDRDDAR